MSPASRVGSQFLLVCLRTGVSSGNRPVFEKENRKCRACLEDSPWFVCPGVCLLGRVGKSRYRRGCPDDKISLMFVVVCISDLCFLSLYYLLIPSHFRPLKGDPLVVFVFRQNLGVSRTPSYVFCLFCSPFAPFPLCTLPTVYKAIP